MGKSAVFSSHLKRMLGIVINPLLIAQSVRKQWHTSLLGIGKMHLKSIQEQLFEVLCLTVSYLKERPASKHFSRKALFSTVG